MWSLVLLGVFMKVDAYELEVTFEPERSYMEGKAVVELTGEMDKELVFYLHGELQVDSVDSDLKLTGIKQERVFCKGEYSLIATKVTLGIEDSCESEPIEIYYSGFFNPSCARALSDYMGIMPGEVLLRSFGYSLWFPVFLADDQDGYKTDFRKVTINTPAGLTSVFVGDKLDEYVEDGCKVTQWQALDTDLLDAQCTAREYELKSGDNCFVYHLRDQKSAENAGKVLEFAGKISALFADHYRPEADRKSLHVLEMPQYGDISSGNVIGINEDSWMMFTDDRNSQFLIAHELVHSYVRIDVSKTNPLAALVVEGFPSFFFLPVLADMWGEDWYNDYMERIEKYYLGIKETGKTPRGWPVPDEKAILELTYEDIGRYKDCFILSDKVLLFFNYLRKSMEAERFYEFSKRLFELEDIDYVKFEGLILEYLPGAESDLDIWLNQTKYPERFRLKD
ncbi:hypothetical protein JXM67_12515 [candidate division WOR-3 bacterium]|nr:hypothetical protein [candidate division WOR-3 bacterium]